MRGLLAAGLTVGLLIFAGVVQAQPEWGSSFERPWGPTGEPEVWAWQQPVQGEPIRLMVANFPTREVNVRVLDEDGQILFEERLDTGQHRTAQALWHVPEDAAPGSVLLVGEGSDGTVAESRLQLYAAPHLFVPTREPPAPMQRAYLQVVGFDAGRVDVTIRQGDVAWGGTWTVGETEEPERVDEVDAELDVPGAQDPARVLQTGGRGQGVSVGFPVLGGPVAVWFNGTVRGEPVSVHENWTAPAANLPLVWMEPGDSATVGDPLHAFGFGWTSVDEVEWAGAPLAAPEPAHGFFQMMLPAPDEEGDATLRVVGVGPDGAPQEATRAMRVVPQPTLVAHGDVPLPPLALALAVLALTALLRKQS